MLKRVYRRVTPHVIRSRLSRIAAAFRDEPASPTHTKWLSDGGELLALEFDLSPQSFVVDVGAYRGRWAADIFTRYQCRVAAIEPIETFASEISKKYGRNPNILVYPIGLGERTRTETIALLGDASSTMRESSSGELVTFVDVEEWLEHNVSGTIDLMSMNCEGGEYEILPRLIHTQSIRRVERILVQFHQLGAGATRQREEIRSALSSTHREIYNYPFLWELWERK